jgi:endoglycosylceramidase
MNLRHPAFFPPAVVASLLWLGGCNPPPQYEICATPDYGAATEAAAPLHADGHYFRDVDGRAVLLRGVNATGDAKVPPFQSVNSPLLFDPLPGWGINTVRLLFTWEAFEPARCHYDNDYLAYYEQAVEWAAERNLYVIVDFHQDAYSRFNVNGCGEGFPEWAVTSAIIKSIPDNTPACDGWGAAMITDAAMHTTWNHFHSDREGARTRYLDMVKAVAERMSDHANVIGYEIMNEPWGSNAQLNKLINDVGAAVRDRHPSAILFVPAHALVSGGVKENTLAQPTHANIVYSSHYYDPSVYFKNWNGSPLDPALNKALAKATGWNAPLIMSEFGAPADTLNVEAYMEAYYDWLDANFVSGTQWSYTPAWTPQHKDGWNAEDFSIVDDSGQLRSALFVPRPYPQYTAGTPQQFERTENGFSYRWQNNSALGTTEIYLPAGYADGKTVAVTGDANCSLQTRKLVCNSNANAEITVALHP